jgi:hypothetical protein
MDERTFIRRVRIAVSVIFGLITLAIVILCVRSYGWRDHFTSNGSLWNRWGIAIHSFRGSATFVLPHPDATLIVESSRKEAMRHNANFFVRPDRGGGFAIESNPVLKKVRMPYWVLVIASAWITLATAVPPQSLRFSLRLLLIATTMVALVLGLSVWLAR